MVEARWYPALEITWESIIGESAIGESVVGESGIGLPEISESTNEQVDLVLAAVDEFHPSAVEEAPRRLRIHFSDHTSRDRAADAVRALPGNLRAEPLDVSDEAWAERSQAALKPVRVGRLTVAPPWASGSLLDAQSTIIIQPSMGFGTGHHPSTRLCLQLLQLEALDRGLTVLDAGTGSGVLAISAAKLGATRVVAVDYDGDALTSASENVALNQVADRIDLQRGDLTQHPPSLPEIFDVVTANLTGAMLARHATALVGWLGHDGSLIVSGFQEDEVPRIRAAFADVGWTATAQVTEDTWVALQLRHAHPPGS